MGKEGETTPGEGGEHDSAARTQKRHDKRVPPVVVGVDGAEDN